MCRCADVRHCVASVEICACAHVRHTMQMCGVEYRVCCSVLQCVAVYCTCVAARCVAYSIVWRADVRQHICIMCAHMHSVCGVCVCMFGCHTHTYRLFHRALLQKRRVSLWSLRMRMPCTQCRCTCNADVCTCAHVMCCSRTSTPRTQCRCAPQIHCKFADVFTCAHVKRRTQCRCAPRTQCRWVHLCTRDTSHTQNT